MRLIRNPAVGMAAAILGIAALLGGSLGLATAATRPLSPGYNLISGPFQGPVEPDAFVSCLPPASWTSMYVWNSTTQSWSHYFNTQTSDNIPGFVNSPEAGGISVLPQASGVVIYITQNVENPFFIEVATESCPT